MLVPLPGMPSRVVTPAAQARRTFGFEGTIVGTVGLGSADSFGGAQLVALDLDTALVHFGADGKVDAIDIAVVDGADVTEVQQAIEDVLPSQTEVVTGEEVAQETADNVNQFVNVFTPCRPPSGVRTRSRSATSSGRTSATSPWSWGCVRSSDPRRSRCAFCAWTSRG